MNNQANEEQLDGQSVSGASWLTLSGRLEWWRQRKKFHEHEARKAESHMEKIKQQMRLLTKEPT